VGAGGSGGMGVVMMGWDCDSITSTFSKTVALRKREDTGNQNRRHQITLPGELAVEESDYVVVVVAVVVVVVMMIMSTCNESIGERVTARHSECLERTAYSNKQKSILRHIERPPSCRLL